MDVSVIAKLIDAVERLTEAVLSVSAAVSDLLEEDELLERDSSGSRSVDTGSLKGPGT